MCVSDIFLRSPDIARRYIFQPKTRVGTIFIPNSDRRHDKSSQKVAFQLNFPNFVESESHRRSYEKTRTFTRRRSPRAGGAPCGTVGCLCLSGHTLDRNHRIHPGTSPRRRARRPPHVVVERKDGRGRGARHVVRRQTRAGLHEARGHERGGRRLRQLGDDRGQRRTGRRGGRRPFDALLAERAGFALLREIRPRADVRTLDAAGGLRHGEGRVRTLGAVPDSGADAPDDPHGPLAGGGRGDGTPGRKRTARARRHPPVGAHAGQLAREVQRPAGRLCPAGRGRRREPVQRLCGGSG